ncbi:MAG: hypothetical protein QM648_02975 [Solirubrobacterales bacterium]
MNRPKATRLRLCLAVVAAAALAAFVMPAAANADFITAGSGVDVSFDDPTPGAHSDLTVTHHYAYDGMPSSPSGCTLSVPPYPNPCYDGFGRTGDDLKQWILDTPAGFYGNPRAIPFAARCTQDQMRSYQKNALKPGYGPMPGAQCPASAQVGTATLTLKDDPGAGGIATKVLDGKIYVVQSADPLQEVPTTLFTVFETTSTNCAALSLETNCVVAALSRTQIAPVTSGPQGDYRLRSVSELIDRPDLSPAAGLADNSLTGAITGITQSLWGDPREHGNSAAVSAFQTNPTTCGDWDSTLYARTYGTSGPVGNEVVAAHGTDSQTHTLEGTANPGGGDSSGSYAEFDSAPTTADCSGSKPALTAGATAAVDNNARGAYPGLTVNIANPNSDDRDKTKKLVTTLPSTITVNAAALGNVCEQAQLVTDSCPANSQIGTADITSPVLSATQHGRVYMTRGATQGLPYLSIWVNGPNDDPAGAFTFRLDATTQFVGTSANMIETTFDNLPSLPFDSFVVHINGGDSNNSLLLNRKCPGDGSTPDDGPITFAMNGYTGANASSSSATSLAPCYGVDNPGKVTKCVKQGKKLSVSPKNLIAKSTVANVQLLTGSKSSSTKSRAKDSSNPFSFKLTLKKSTYKKNKTYYYGYKVTYKDGHVIKTKTNKFKTCK